jgi:hypothetical protein
MEAPKPRTEPEQTEPEVGSDRRPLSTETIGQEEVCFCCGASPCVMVPMELTYGWRPISGAPRDGTRVLLWDTPDVVIAGWLSYPNHMNGRGGMWQMWECEPFGEDANKPTHWMPLPPPPREDGE